MLITYSGSNLTEARAAWAQAFEHILRQAGGVEVPSASNGVAVKELALVAFDSAASLLKPGERHQMGANPMPENRRIWASVTRLADGRLMVAINYSEA
jgi:hypothetical protein